MEIYSSDCEKCGKGKVVYYFEIGEEGVDTFPCKECGWDNRAIESKNSIAFKAAISVAIGILLSVFNTNLQDHHTYSVKYPLLQLIEIPIVLYILYLIHKANNPYGRFSDSIQNSDDK